MNRFSRADVITSQVEYLHTLFPYLNLSPVYQRESGIWSIERKQLFIDSLINGFDVPKMYFNQIDKVQDVDGDTRFIRYEVIDGKQRLETVEEFLSGEFRLASDCVFEDDRSYNIGGMSYDELELEYPDVAFTLMRYVFDIVVLDHFEEDKVDEFFIRLNGGEPLNAQEKRNACNCYLRGRVKAVAKRHSFIKDCLRKRPRYKNDELVAKFFLITDQFATQDKIVDTKKNRLDELYERSKNKTLTNETVNVIERQVDDTLSILKQVFSTQDPLLNSIGNVVVFYIAAFLDPGLWKRKAVRELVKSFESMRKEIVNKDTDALSRDEFLLFFCCDEYNSSVQSANDGSALMIRARYINGYLMANGNVPQFAAYCRHGFQYAGCR